MKYTTLVLMLCFFVSYPQDFFVSQVKVDYDIVETEGVKTKEKKALLLFNTTNSVFLYKNGSESREVSTTEESEGNDVNLNFNTNYIDTLENRVYFDNRKKNYIRTALNFNTNKRVFIKDAIKSLNWNITEESKQIDAFKCIKATLNFEGNEYIAWYTPSVPTSFGPYDFGQLPGLILELYTADHQLYIAATKVSYPHEQRVQLPIGETTYISQADYDTLTKKFLDSMGNAMKDRLTRIITKGGRGYKIQNIKVETKTTKKGQKNKDH